MSSIHFLVHPLPGNEDQLNERLKEVAERTNRCAYVSPSVFSANKNVAVKQCVVSTNHVAFLLEDGRVYRIPYSVLPERLDLSKNENAKVLNLKGSSNAQSSSRVPTRNRGRIIRTTSTRGRGGGGGVIMGSRPVVPAPFVPEELVSQAQVVLQGKSRNLILRELQRTNLDVNLAVNNLLSRDDEEGEDVDDSQDSYMPGDDLISLLDAGIHTDHPSVIIDADAMFSEDMFGYSTIRSRSSSRGRERDRDTERDRDRESMFRFRERQYPSSRRWLETALRDSGSADKQPEGMQESKKTTNNEANPIWLGDDLEFWTEAQNQPIRFTQISGLYSELIGLSTSGHLYQWKWSEPEPYSNSENPFIYHSKATSLGLAGEKIVFLASCCVRATVVTESGKVATWIDDSLQALGGKLEHSAQIFPEFICDKIAGLFVCSLYTCVRLESGTLYWWGVAPFNQRKKLWEKMRTKGKKCKSTSYSSEILAGVQVCMRSSPMYHPGALAFTTSGGVPRVGQLTTAAWNLTDTCNFKILPPCSLDKTKDKKSTDLKDSNVKTTVADTKVDRQEMPPPPSPASSTCSEPASSPLPHNNKRKQRQMSVKEGSEDKREEESWPLKDVIFVEDVKSAPVGRVIKVDGAYAAILFSSKHSNTAQTSSEDVNSLLQECRLLRKDELQIVKGTPRLPDCFQRTPKRINILDSGQILTMAVDGQGVHAIVKTENKLSYVLYNLNCGKVEQDSPFPTDTQSFLGQDQKLISLNICGENETITMLRDGNSTIYPLAKDCTDSVRDPVWLDLPPARALGLGVHSLKETMANQKNQVAIVVLALERQTLLPSILKGELETIRQTLATLERESVLQPGDATLQSVLNERCDGNRNIFHAAVSTCFPVSNREPTEGEGLDSLDALAAGCLVPSNGNSLPSRSGLPTVSLRDMMRRASSNRSLENRDGEVSIPTLNWPPEPSDSTSTGTSLPSNVEGSSDKKSIALNILILLCESSVLKPYLKDLISARDSDGCTPFMCAVAGRAYSAALVLMDTSQRISRELSMDTESHQRALHSMLYPRGCHPDDSPLHVLCCNDTCSFTWTGAEHINQYIFECRTCGLTGSLCCCTECARVCHKGHDCKLKRTSPTAYCDCWEKCKCKALIAGNQSARFQLLNRLITETDLVNQANGRGESILLFLVQTVGRQVEEQRQYRPARPRSSSNRKILSATEIEAEMPDHDLEPPKFSRRALEKLLNDWHAIKMMIMTGWRANLVTEFYEPQTYLNSQNGTALLDKFTHCLLVKCNTEMLDTLLATLIREIQNEAVPGRQSEARLVARRFVRSVTRIFVILSIEMAPSSSRKKSSQPLMKCRRVFQALLNIAVEELSETADSLIAPVRMGVSRPTAPFSLISSCVDAVNGSEELFAVDPMLTRSNGGQEIISEVPSVVELSGPGVSNPGPSGPSREDDEVDVGGGNDVAEQFPSEHNEEGGRNGLANLRHRIELLLSESESDSDSNPDSASYQSNQDNASAQRSATTGATAGSDAGVASLPYFSEDDSADSSNGEDEEESEAGETEPDNEDLAFLDEQLERRAPSGPAGGPRNNLAPQHMQWALRPRGSGGIGTNPNTLRRSTTGATSVAAAAAAAITQECAASMATTTVCLARAFGIVVRQIADLLAILQDCSTAMHTNLPRQLELSYQELANLQHFLEGHLKPTWDWLMSVMDSTEAQLRFGCALSNNSDPAHPSHPLHSQHNKTATGTGARRIGTTEESHSVDSRRRGRLIAAPRSNTSSDGLNARRDFLSYALSLMRAHNNEHFDSLPVIDVSSLKHIAYVFDALIYYMRSGSEVIESDSSREGVVSNPWLEPEENENEEPDYEVPANPPNDTESIDEDSHLVPSKGRKHPFFQRSDSTLFLGCPPPDPFTTPLAEALPLAEQPHLLQPNARREDLFGIPRQPVLPFGNPSASSYDSLPTKMGLSNRSSESNPAAFLASPMSFLSSVPLTSTLPTKMETEESVLTVDPVPNTPTASTNTPIFASATSSFQLLPSVPTDQEMRTDDTSSPCPPESRAPIIVAAPSNKKPDLSSPHKSSVIVHAGSIRSPSVSTPESGPIYMGGAPSPIAEVTVQSSNHMPSAVPIQQHRPEELVGTPFSQHPSAMDTSQPSTSNVRSPSQNLGSHLISHDILLGRWRLSLELFGRVFVEDVGSEQGSIISELGGFPVKEARFRREMEKLRGSQQRDLNLLKIERDRTSLLQQTFKELNSQCNNYGRRNTGSSPPLGISRVKVTFKDEPGEGSGVARSFYTAIAEAVLSSERLPNLEACQVGTRSVQYNLIQRLRSKERERELQRRSSQAQLQSSTRSRETGAGNNSVILRYESLPYIPNSGADSQPNSHLTAHRQQLGQSGSGNGSAASSDNILDLDMFNLVDRSRRGASTPQADLEEEDEVEDNAPLFYQPGKRGFYSPRQGKCTPERLNAFRNVGRIIGLCVLQNELCPIYLNRHVIKYLLGRRIGWHDLAFFDPVLYESLRQIALDAEANTSNTYLINLDLQFSIDVCPEEGGGSVELVPNGRDLEVTTQNVYDYVRKYAEYRMLKSQEKALESLKSGLYDVLPSNSLEGLTAEDFRLLINGVGEINVHTIISYTTFNDESGEGGDKLIRFKRWFWSNMEKMSNHEKQDLVYFWTGSPAIPASEDGFQPMPSITIRPADDQHLPTANTCISRLYIPLYSSKCILRAKLLLAVKTKNFGFV